VRLAAGFGVGVGLGLAPLLGKVRVPGFSALISLFPPGLGAVVIPLAAFLMGVVAVAAQIFGSAVPRGRKRLFATTRKVIAILLLALLLLIVLYFLVVVRVEAQGETVPVVVGFARLPACGCAAAISDLQCIEELSLRPSAIESCWGTRQVRLCELALGLLYLTVMTSFGALIGIVLGVEQQAARAAPGRR